MVRWKKDRDVSTFVEHLESYRVIDENGHVGFNSGFAIHTLLSVVRSSLQFNDHLTEEERTDVINKGFWRVAEHGPVTPSTLLASINNGLNEFKRKPNLDYIVLTNISIHRSMPLGRKKVGSMTVSFPYDLRGEFSKARKSAIVRPQRTTSVDDPVTYRWVKVTGALGRTESSVIEQSINCIDLLRGIWNLHKNRQFAWRVSVGRRKPVNHFVRGPFLSLHSRTGERVTDQFYYEPNFSMVDVRPMSRRDFRATMEYERRVRTILRRHRYRDCLEDKFIRYAQALDEGNWELSFLKMWGLLEMLTDTSNEKGYQRTIKRASFLWNDTEVSRGVLQQLREYRNRWVHKQEVTDDMESHLFNLKNHVEMLMNYHLRNWFRCETLEQSCAVLDWPVEVATLKRRRMVADLVLKYRARR